MKIKLKGRGLVYEQYMELLITIFPEQIEIYPNSVQHRDGCTVFLIRYKEQRRFVCIEIEPPSDLFRDFEGEEYQAEKTRIKICHLRSENAQKLRQWFRYTAPVPLGREGMSIGLGDRLGLATPGHIRLLANEQGIRPVLAQQSVRELTLTQRTFSEVLDVASWAVFQEGYLAGFSADADHLKTLDEVRKALETGYSMITLDCSEYIDHAIASQLEEQVNHAYSNLPEEMIQRYEDEYLNQLFSVGGEILRFEIGDFKRIVLTYRKALDYVKYIYDSVLKSYGQIDFEISIDETLTPTTPQAHYFVARELTRSQVEFTSLAPRFCGEFQKGVDYRGDLRQFEDEFRIHALIADHFGYRLSIHSGSDKFSIFPIIAKYTHGRVHVKTAGTNWLEAVRVIAQVNPALYRKMHDYALTHFAEAKQFYIVTTDLNRIPVLQNLTDQEIPILLDHDDSRQLLHITYGLLLSAKDTGGDDLFRQAFFRTLIENEETYARLLEKHIGRHLQLLHNLG